MPITACSHCKRKFKVSLDVIGSSLTCPRCGEPFTARPLHAGPRKRHGTPPIVYAAIGLGAVLVALVIRAVFSPPDKPAAAEAAPREEAVSRSTARKRPPAASETKPPLTPRAQMLDSLRRLVEMMRDPDHPLLPGRLDYVELYARRRGREQGLPPWNDLAPEAQYAARERALQEVLGNDQDRAFQAHAVLADSEVLDFGSGRAKVRALLRDPTTLREREVVFHLRGAGGVWKIADLDRGPIRAGGTPSAEGTEGGSTSPVDETLARLRRKTNPEADVAEVEPYEDTPTSLRSEIARELDVLLDVSQTVKAGRARRRLVAIGRPAVPFLLNALVPLDLSDSADLVRAVRVTQALMDLTGRDWVVVPGSNEASMTGEGRDANERTLRRWFGWWRANRDTYRGPPEADGGGEVPPDDGR